MTIHYPAQVTVETSAAYHCGYCYRVAHVLLAKLVAVEEMDIRTAVDSDNCG